MLKFLVDESTGKNVADAISEDGYDAKFVGDFMKGSKDSDIFRFAVKENRIIITNDKDFGEMVYRILGIKTGLILLRLNNDNSKTRTDVLRKIIGNYGEKLEGSLVVASENKVRIRRF